MRLTQREAGARKVVSVCWLAVKQEPSSRERRGISQQTIIAFVLEAGYYKCLDFGESAWFDKVCSKPNFSL